MHMVIVDAFIGRDCCRQSNVTFGFRVVSVECVNMKHIFDVT